jgi:hypothetical protein
MSNATRKIAVSAALRARMSSPPGGAGGYQTFVNEILKRMEGDSLVVDDELVERIEHYAFDYGRGPWQLLLRDLLTEIESSAPRP